MITVKTMKQIPTSRTIRSSRASSFLGREHTVASEQARITIGKIQLLSSEARRQWLNSMYFDRYI